MKERPKGSEEVIFYKFQEVPMMSFKVARKKKDSGNFLNDFQKSNWLSK